MFENEIWHQVEDFPNYMVSDRGRVKHIDRIEARQVTINERGFPVVVLFGYQGRDSKSRYLRQINKLVATAFLPPPLYEEDTFVWHIDGDLQNCHVENLRWDSKRRVHEWNAMHRREGPQLRTPRVQNNRTGKIYENAYECGLAEGELESKIVWRIERQNRYEEDETGRYRYVYS